MLRLGATGRGVELLQQILRDRGYYFGAINGRFEQRTLEAVTYFQQTSVGQDRRPLKVDGEVGEKTLWALRSGPTQQKLGIDRPLALRPGATVTLSATRHHVIAAAEHYHNTQEEPLGSNRGTRIDQWTGAQGDDQGPPWCEYFVSAVWLEALGKHPLGARLGSCSRAHEIAKKLGFWRDHLTPCPGDQFVMLYQSKPGHGHTGFVTGVQLFGGMATQVSTIEGNCGHRVARRIRDVSTIAGFIDPLGHPRNFTPGLAKGALPLQGEPTV